MIVPGAGAISANEPGGGPAVETFGAISSHLVAGAARGVVANLSYGTAIIGSIAATSQVLPRVASLGSTTAAVVADSLLTVSLAEGGCVQAISDASSEVSPSLGQGWALVGSVQASSALAPTMKAISALDIDFSTQVFLRKRRYG